MIEIASEPMNGGPEQVGGKLCFHGFFVWPTGLQLNNQTEYIPTTSIFISSP